MHSHLTAVLPPQFVGCGELPVPGAVRVAR
jgi:hypothetical protein